MEVMWKDLPTCNEIEVSNTGLVRNKLTGTIYKPAIDRYGYYKLGINISKERKYFTVHRLVALTWIPNLEGKPQVNHINGNKLDNRVENLEWSSASENVTHSFELGLNDNKFTVTVEDLESGVIKHYRSIKSIAKFLDIYPSTLVPLMKYSRDNPIYGRYILTVTEDELLKNPVNTIKDGVVLYVLDWLTGNIVKYNSVMIAAYFTGVRCLSGSIASTLRRNESQVLDFIGYSFANKEEYLINYSPNFNVEEIIRIREEYWFKPYSPKSSRYILYDYYTKEEFLFDSVPETLDFLNSKDPTNNIVTPNKLSTSMHAAKRNNKTALVKGYGLKSDTNDIEWTNYDEEFIISSKYECLAPIAVYEVTDQAGKKLVIGKHNLCKTLGYGIDGSEGYAVINRLIRLFNDPNVSVKRLNSPIL